MVKISWRRYNVPKKDFF